GELVPRRRLVAELTEVDVLLANHGSLILLDIGNLCFDAPIWQVSGNRDAIADRSIRPSAPGAQGRAGTNHRRAESKGRRRPLGRRDGAAMLAPRCYRPAHGRAFGFGADFHGNGTLQRTDQEIDKFLRRQTAYEDGNHELAPQGFGRKIRWLQ